MNRPNIVSTGSAGADATTVAASSARRPYESPRLRVLGSVRDITLGAPSIGSDGTTSGPKGGGPG
jgi:hypothetical protein